MQEENRQVSQMQLQRFCQEQGNMPFVETSAKNNMNVEQAFIKLAEKALARQEEMSRKMEEHTQSQRAIEREKNKKLGHIHGKKTKKENCKC
jgi:predicted kinase